MSELKTVSVLDSLSVANAGTGADQFEYANLLPNATAYTASNSARWTSFNEQPENSLDELYRARQLASEYLVHTSVRITRGPASEREIWSDRFTKGSVELFGAPEKQEVQKLIAKEVSWLNNLAKHPRISASHCELLLDTYIPMVSTAEISDESRDDSAEQWAIHNFGEHILEKFSGIPDIVDATGKEIITPTDLKVIVDASIQWLAEADDPDWLKWTSQVTENGTGMSVGPSKFLIKIGGKREASTPEEIKPVLLHEFLAHARRGLYGHKTADKQLVTGIPGYLDYEEGYGVLLESTITGKVPERATDRYLDIALALGTVDGKQRSRQEVYELSYARQLIRAQLEGRDQTYMERLPNKVWSHVDRIYKGGIGNDTSQHQAVFTKDIAYYVGYKHMAVYIEGELKSGKTPEEIFNFLTLGRFNPTDDAHVERVKKAHAIK